MSAYFYLCCKNCEISLYLGKKIASEEKSLTLQGVYLEENKAWNNDVRAWRVIQRFLQDHEMHELLFASDEHFPEIHLYEPANTDELLSK